jgi:hypothetical protein
VKKYKEFLLEDYWNKSDLDFDNFLNLKKYTIEKPNTSTVVNAKLMNILKNISIEDIELIPHRENNYNMLQTYNVSFGKNLNILWNMQFAAHQSTNFDAIYFFNTPITIECDHGDLNRSHFPKAIPTSVRGLNLGYKIYKKLLIYEGWLTTEDNSAIGAKIVWEKLGSTPDVLGVITACSAYVVMKDLDPDLIEISLEKFLVSCKNLGDLNKQCFISSELKEKYNDIIKNYI